MDKTRARHEVDSQGKEQYLAKEALNRGICSGIVAACTRIETRQRARGNKQRYKRIERSQIEQIINMAQTMNKDNYELRVLELILYALRQAARGQITTELASSIRDNIYALLRNKKEYSNNYIAYILREYATTLKWTYEIITKLEKTMRNQGKNNTICKQLLQLTKELCNSDKVDKVFDTFIKKLNI